MNDWLSEIGQRQTDNYEALCRESSAIRLDIDQCVRDGKRMARVIRELVEYISNLDDDDYVKWRKLTDDAKELVKCSGG